MKFIKTSLYIFGGLVLLAGIAAGVFVATFDANDYKSQISEQVKQQTGRDFKLADIKPAVFPWLGIELQELSLGNAKGFSEKQMLKIESLDVRVALLPLLSGEVKIDTLRVHGLELALAKNSQGVTNWDDILQKQQTSKEKPATDVKKGKALKSESAPAEEVRSLGALMVDGVDIKDASIKWSDATTNQNISLDGFNLNTGEIKPGKLTPVVLKTRVSLAEPKASIEVEMKTKLGFDSELRRLQLESLNLKIDAVLKELGIDQAFISLNTKLDADLKTQKFNLAEIVLDINASGELIPGGKITAKIKSAADIDLLKETASINPLSIETLGLNVQSEITVNDFLLSPKARGRFNLEKFNPTELMTKLAIALPEMQSKKALKISQLSFDFSGTEKSISLSKLSIGLDGSQIKGDLLVSQFDKPAITYNLSLDKINVDNYLPPVPPEEKSSKDKPANTTVSTNSSKDTPIDLPVVMLRDLNIKGQFKAKEIQAIDQTIKQLSVETVAKGGVIKLPKISAKLLEGSILMSAQLDVRKNTPRYQLSVNGKNLEADSIASPILQDMLGKKEVRLSGASDVDLNIRSKGRSVKQLMANSNGQFEFNMGKAELHEVDIEFYARQAVTAYMDEKKIPVKDRLRGKYKPRKTTALKVVHASAKITNGLVVNEDLLVDSTRFKVTGAGKINLVKETINYRAIVDINPASVKTTGEKIMNVPMPVNVKGSFSVPDIEIDNKTWFKGIRKVLKSEFKKSVTDKTDKKIDKAKDKLKDKLKGLIKW